MCFALSFPAVLPRSIALLTTTLCLAACSTAELADPRVVREELAFRGDSSRIATIAEAAARARVPRDVLLTLAWSESRLVRNQPDAEHEQDFETCGLFGLDEGDVRAHAAALANTDAASLCNDTALDAAAAAARLRELADTSGLTSSSTDGDWFKILDAWHPALAERAFPYAEYVARMRREGFRGTDEAGETIYMPPLEALALPTFARGVGVTRAASTPDTSVATWEGPACRYTPASRGMGDVDYVIIHTCEGGFAGCVATVSACGRPAVSAHYVTSYTGMSVQLVEENDIAWHVGCLNSSSIGIEHEGYSSTNPHPDAQYCQSARLVRSICDRWDIPCDRAHIIGHVEANDMFCHGSHTDPGPYWDWDTFMSYVRRGGCDACTPTTEVCDGHDNDCDGMVDEGVANSCGACGEEPVEVCDGHDNDCDGIVDEGVLNACGTCGDAPVEECDGLDNDCDGIVDNGTCIPGVDGGTPRVDAGRSDAGSSVLPDGAVTRDGGLGLTPMDPGCSVSGTHATRNASAFWLVALLSISSLLVIRRRA